MPTEDQLIEIKRKLPGRYSPIIQARLKKKTGKTLTQQHIRRGLMFEHQNKVIIKEAMLLAKNYELKTKKL